MSTALSCTGVSKTFRIAPLPIVSLQERFMHPFRSRRTAAIPALQDVSMQVKKGEWVGIYGHNGSGKTTLLRILAGLMRPDDGSVMRTGRLASFFGAGAGFHPERTARENAYLHGLLHGQTLADARRNAERVVELAAIQSHADLPIKCLSTGMTLRLGFAACMCVDAETYLFDEVLAVGDADFRQTCTDCFAALRERGATVVMVHHDHAALERLCDRIMYLDHGVCLPSLPAGSNDR